MGLPQQLFETRMPEGYSKHGIRKSLALGSMLLVCFTLAGCSKPPVERPIDYSWLPKADDLLNATQSVIDAVREDRLEQWAKDDRSLPGMISSTVQRRPGLVEAIRAADDTAPRVVVAQELAYVALKHRTKFSWKSIDYAILLKTEGKWALVGIETMRCRGFDDFADFGRAYEGDALDEIKQEISRRRKRPAGISLFVLNSHNIDLGGQFELPDEWDGEILDIRTAHFAGIALPTKYDSPHQMGVLMFIDRDPGGNVVRTEGYWQSYGNLVRNRCYFNPDTMPIVDANGRGVSQQTTALIRSLFKTGELDEVCEQLAVAPDNQAALLYLDDARLCAIGRDGDCESLIVELARKIDVEFQFDPEFGFDR